MEKSIFNALLLPPGCCLMILVIGVILVFYYKKAGLTFIILGTLLLWFLSTPLSAFWLALPLQPSPLTSHSHLASQAQAIVVLGGGVYEDAPEYHHQTVLANTTQARVRYAAYLYQKIQLPILVTGGDKSGPKDQTEAYCMAKTLKNDYRVPVRWMEFKSEDTFENALFSAKILKLAGVHTIILVTDAIHMKRAAWSFQYAGLNVIPAPMHFITLPHNHYTWEALLPKGSNKSDYCLHEYWGMLYYWLKTKYAST